MWYNPIMIWLLKSPLHGLLSKTMLLLTVTGRRSRKSITIPTNYLHEGNTLWIVSWRDRMWWRNLRGGAPVAVRLAGRSADGRGHAIEDPHVVSQSLCDYYRRVPQYARYVGIGLDAAQQPVKADCERAAQKMVMIRIDL